MPEGKFFPGLPPPGVKVKRVGAYPSDDSEPEDVVRMREQEELKKAAARLRAFTEQAKQQAIAENAPLIQAGLPEGVERQSATQQMTPWRIAHSDMLRAEEAGNTKLAEKLKKLRDYTMEQDQGSQEAGMKDALAASRGTLAGVATDVLAPVYRGFDTFARTASFGGSELVKAAARKGAHALGIAPDMDTSEAAERMLLEEGARGGVGKFAGGVADIIGVVRGFGGKLPAPGKMGEKFVGPMGAAEKLAAGWLGKGGAKELAARVMDSSVGGMVSANAMLQLGEAGVAALNDLFYGDSTTRPRAMEVIKSMPMAAVNSAILGGFTPVLQGIGRGVSGRLMGKWAPGVMAGQKLKLLDLKARAAQGTGGVFEFMGFAGMPHVSEDGFSVFQPYIDVFSQDKEKRANGWVEILSQMTGGFMMGAAHGRHLGDKSHLPDKQFILKDKPFLPKEVEHALRVSTREAVDAMMKSANGESDAMASLLTAIQMREALGYDAPGTAAKILDPARNEFVREKIKRDKEKDAEDRKIEEERETKRYDNARPEDLGFLQPGAGYASETAMREQGRLPFMVDKNGNTSSPSMVESWDPSFRPDLADPGTKLRINYGLKGKNKALWEDVQVVRPIYFKGGDRKGQLKGVLVRLDSTGAMGMFDAADVRTGLVKMADGTSLDAVQSFKEGESSAREAKEPKLLGPGQHPDAKGQRAFPFGKSVKTKQGPLPMPFPGVTEAATAQAPNADAPKLSERPLQGSQTRETISDKLGLTDAAVKPGERRLDLSDKPTIVGEPIVEKKAEKRESAEEAADAAVAGAEDTINVAFPGTTRKTKPKEGKLGPLLRYAGPERRKEVLPAARARRSAESLRRGADREKNTDEKTGLGNERAWNDSIKRLPGSGDVVALIDGTNSSSANEKEVGGHTNGDKVFAGYGAKLREARTKSGADVALFRKSGGDEFAVRGKPAEVRKFLKALSENNKVGESKLADGKTYEHRLIAGDGKETVAKADESQMERHATYRAQAAEAGLGLSRKKEPPPEPPAQEQPKKPKPGPAMPGLPKQKRVTLKPKEQPLTTPGINLIPKKDNVWKKPAAASGSVEFKESSDRGNFGEMTELKSDHKYHIDNATKFTKALIEALRNGDTDKYEGMIESLGENAPGLARIIDDVFKREQKDGLEVANPDVVLTDPAFRREVADLVAEEFMEDVLSSEPNSKLGRAIAKLYEYSAAIEGEASVDKIIELSDKAQAHRERIQEMIGEPLYPRDYYREFGHFSALNASLEAAESYQRQRKDPSQFDGPIEGRALTERTYQEIADLAAERMLEHSTLDFDTVDKLKAELAAKIIERGAKIAGANSEPKPKPKPPAFPGIKGLKARAEEFKKKLEADPELKRELDEFTEEHNAMEEVRATFEEKPKDQAPAPEVKESPSSEATGKQAPVPEAKKPVAPGLIVPDDKMVVKKRELKPHERIVQDEIDRVVETLESLSGEQQNEAVQRVRDMKILLDMVKNKEQEAPFAVYGEKVKVPELGDHVIAKMDDGREVVGVVEASEKEPLGRRLKILTKDGKIERPRLADMVDIAPADVINHDFSQPTEVSKPTFLSWFAGRRKDTPGYERSVRLKRAFDKDQRARGVMRRRGLLTGNKKYDADDAKGEMDERALRARHDTLLGDDYELEARARLVDPSERHRVEMNVTPETGRRKVGDEFIGRDLLGVRKKERLEGEEQKAPFHWFDPKAKLRTEAELAELAKKGGEEGAQADTDLKEYKKLMKLAEFTREVEDNELRADDEAKRVGRGFARVRGSLEDLEKGGTVYVRQQGMKDTHYADPHLLEVKERDGRIVIRRLSVDEMREAFVNDPGLRPEILKFVESKKKSFFERAEDDVKEEIMRHSAAEGEWALERIFEWANGGGEELPGGPLFDSARAWMEKNNRPANEKGPEYLNWLRDLRAQMEPSKKGQSANWVRGKSEKADDVKATGEETLADMVREAILTGRDPVTGNRLKVDDKGDVQQDISPRAGLLLPLAFPGAPPPGTIKLARAAGRQVGGFYRGLGRFVDDVSGAVFESIADQVNKITFRPDKLRLAKTPFGQTKMYAKWVTAARRAEAFMSPSGDEYNAYVLTHLNRNAGMESAFIERMEAALKLPAKMKSAKLNELLEQYTNGKKDPTLEGYDAFMREMYKELKALDLLDKDDDGRFVGTYVPYNRFTYTAEKLAQMAKDLKFDLRKAQRDGDKNAEETILRAIDNLATIRTRSSVKRNHLRVIVSPVPLSQLGDPKTRALLNSGMLNHRSFKSWKEAVAAGLDTSNPVEMMREAMWTQMLAVTRHKLFRALASDRNLVMDPKVDSKIPDWYVEPDTSKQSKHSSWRILDGKRVNPFLMDQLYQMDPKQNWVSKIADYLHMGVKASKALYNPSAIMTNLVGNPMILAMNGMSIPSAYTSYAHSFAQLLLVDPALRPMWEKLPGGKAAVAAAEKGKYGSKRALYMSEGWVTHASDATRELQTIFDADKSLREHILRGYSDHQSLDQAEGLIRNIATVVDKIGAKGIRFYNLIDAAARASLHDHLMNSGHTQEQAANEVNKSFDVQHLPKMWRMVRKGFGSIGADSFVSFKVAMARNATKFLSKSPWVIANAAAMAYAMKMAVAQMYGMDEEEIDSIIDASTPRTGSWMFDKINRATSLVIPWGHHGPRAISMTRFTPHDAILDLVPGAKVWAMGGLDDRGRTSENTNMVTDFFSRSVLAGPYFDWYLNRDPMSGAPIHDRYDSFSDYISEKIGMNVGGVPLALPGQLKGVMPFMNMVLQKKRMLNQMEGGTEPRYEASFPGVKARDSGMRYDTPGASARRRGGTEALIQALTGIRISDPNAIRRMLESAQVGGEDIEKKRGVFRPTIEPGEPGRKNSREEANEAGSLKDAVRGMELWAATLDLERAMRDPDENKDEIAAIRKRISTYFKNERELKVLTKSLLYIGQPAAKHDVVTKLRQLGAYPESEPLINKNKSGTIAPFR